MASQESNAVKNRNSALQEVIDGRMFLRRAEHTLTSALADDEYVDMIPLFAGDRVLRGKVLYLDALDSGNTLDIAVGDTGDADRYLAGQGTPVTGGVALFAGNNVTAAGAQAQDHKYTEDDAIRLTVTVAATTWRLPGAAPASARYGRIVVEAMIVSGV